MLTNFLDMVNKYVQLCDLFNWQKDDAWIAEATKSNEAKIKELDAKIEDAEKNFGETEVREANLAKAEYLSRVGTKVCLLPLFPILLIPNRKKLNLPFVSLVKKLFL